MKKFAQIALLAITLAVSVSSCSIGPLNISFSEPTPTPTVSLNPAAQPIAEMTNAFFKQVAADANAPDPVNRSGSDGVSQDSFNAGFKGSIAYFKPNSMTQLVSRQMLADFAKLYVVDPSAKTEVDPKDLVINGKKAYIKSGRLKVTMKGKLQPSYPDSESATLYFESVKGKWMISGFNIHG